MEENSTTEQGNSTTDADAAAATAASTTGEESTSSTEQRTATDGGDNSDTSTSTDESAADDKSKTGEEDDKTAPASKFDDDLDDWAEKTKRGKPETDRERAALQEIRNSQREFSKQQEAKKAQDALKTGTEEAKPEGDDDEIDDPLEKDVAELKASRDAERTARLQSEYFSANDVTSEEAKAMGDILKEMVESEESPEDKKAAYDYWTNPKRLAKWHKLAKAELGSGAVDTTAVADEAARKERERIAKESHSNGPSRNASAPPADKTSEQKRKDALLERWSK